MLGTAERMCFLAGIVLDLGFDLVFVFVIVGIDPHCVCNANAMRTHCRHCLFRHRFAAACWARCLRLSPSATP
jgi:hypothetical protein